MHDALRYNDDGEQSDTPGQTDSYTVVLTHRGRRAFYIMVRQEDKAKIRNVKVITSEECVPKHKLLVMDMWFKATIRRRRKFEPRVRVWKLNPLGPTGKIIASHNIGIIETHWRRFCHMESEAVDLSYLFNYLYRKLSIEGRGRLV